MIPPVERPAALVLLSLAACGARSSLVEDLCARASCPSGQHWVSAACACAPDPCVPAEAGEATLASLSLDSFTEGSAIAVREGEVYWTTRGGQDDQSGLVSKVSRCGGPVTTLAANQIDPWSIAVDATNVYWGTSSDDGMGHATGGVRKVPLGGGSPIQIATGVFFLGSVATDGSYVYWVGALTPGLWREPIGGGEPTPLVIDQVFNEVFVDETHAYLGQAGTDVISVPTSGGDLTVLGSGFGNGSVMTIDATSVYYQNDDLDIVQIPKGGGPPTTLAHRSVNAIASDGTNLYWAQGNPALGEPEAIVRLPLGGGVATTLSSSTGFAIAVDDVYVYWLVGGDLRRVPK
jgi:hypothetical protein